MEENRLPMPQTVNTDMSRLPELQGLVESYVSILYHDGYADDDTSECIFETVMEMFYGRKIWDTIVLMYK